MSRIGFSVYTLYTHIAVPKAAQKDPEPTGQLLKKER
jgi:hypothetical protein